MDIKSISLAATALVLSTSVNAALITNLSNLDINGTNYDVTFHTGAGDSFNALWDANDDGIFGGGGSTFATAPMFWGSSTEAGDAAIAILNALGSVDWTTTSMSDGFVIPYNVYQGDGLTPGSDSISNTYDVYTALEDDERAWGSTLTDTTVWSNRPIASFSVTTVPIPAAVWLFGSGLLGLIGVARRKVRV